MKKSQFTPEQITFTLKQAESGTSVPEVCRNMGITDQTFYRWKHSWTMALVEERPQRSLGCVL